jgi:arabinose-5-phosphate isomerase
MHGGTDNPTITPQAPWLDAIAAITQGGLGAVNVVDERGHLLGIITDGDLRRSFQTIQPTELGQIKSSRMMTSNPVTVTPDELAYNALQLMENRQSPIAVLPVVDRNGLCVGLIRLHDIVRSGL